MPDRHDEDPTQLVGDGNAARLSTGRLLQSDHSDGAMPGDIGDLISRLRFAVKDGRIWLDTQRVVLIHLSTLTSLRHELIETLGMDKARGFLTRMGYASGTRDAALARKLRPHHSTQDAYLMGPQLRILQGVSHSKPTTLELDIKAGHFFSETLVNESFEADAHIASFGMANDPVCWLQTGYACGFSSTFMGRAIIHKEVECRATGGRHCRIVGKPGQEWDDDDNLQHILRAEFKSIGKQDMGPLRKQNIHAVALPESGNGDKTDQEMVGASSSFVTATQLIAKVSETNATVLFFGETGVGKERFALSLHSISKRADKPFIAINCAAIPENLIEAELFGVEKGAYTGATASRPGRFERANGGTLFLDEVGNLSLPAQIKLLRAIQEREFERVGGTTIRTADVRIIAATNINLEDAVKRNEFRSDLYYRLNVFPVHIPPLRERRDDIPLLMMHFLKKYALRHDKDISGFTIRAVDALYEYSYPGNIRELENMVERAVILAEDGHPIDTVHLFRASDNIGDEILKLDQSGTLQSNCMADEPDADSGQLFETFIKSQNSLGGLEETLLLEAINRCDGNVTKAARLLGLTRPQMAYRLKKCAPERVNASSD